MPPCRVPWGRRPAETMLAAWRRYWFTPASLTDLGVSRAVRAAIVLYQNGTTRFLHVGMVARGLWTPVPVLGLLHVPQAAPATLRVMALASSTLLKARTADRAAHRAPCGGPGACRPGTPSGCGGSRSRAPRRR